MAISIIHFVLGACSYSSSGILLNLSAVTLHIYLCSASGLKISGMMSGLKSVMILLNFLKLKMLILMMSMLFLMIQRLVHCICFYLV